MCGRFTLVPGGAEHVPEHFDVRGPAPDARWNLAPSQEAAVVRTGDGGRELVRLRWGLVPAWSKDPADARAPINARSETVAGKPSFRAAYARRRCLVPASGWYEWEKPPADAPRPKGVRAAPKQPWLIWPTEAGSPDDEGLFAMAGIWERWAPREGEDGAPLETFAILTADARDEVAGIHPRMPVVLRPAEYEAWLDAATGTRELHALLQPQGRPELTARPVSAAVNNARHDAPDCIAGTEGLF